MMGRHWHLFRVALQFFTRIPVRIDDWHPEDLESASRYAPLVGVVVAIGAILAYAVGLLSGSPVLAAFLSVMVSVVLTGAFHEDGLADAVDGLGGGQTPERVLAIMKDSRIGTYGTLALIASIGLRTFALAALPAALACLAILLQHTWARAVSISLIGQLPYVQADQASKVKPVAKALHEADRRFALLAGVWPALLLPGVLGIAALAAGWGIRLACVRGFRKRLGGYTGDLLGACEQLAEMAILLTLVCLWPYT
ncbi:MAG: adenosylcobinamide-GDP ribazoletransferase [Gammaproteobacteria bacterium]|nr:MAG: adenosylcobinamide-GDP ribazoletransferase [Gammaproteobacteria bacterium]